MFDLFAVQKEYTFFQTVESFSITPIPSVYLSQGNELQGRGKLDKNKKMSGLETYALKKLAIRISATARTA